MNALQERIGKGKFALSLPLFGLFVFWLSVLVGSYFQLLLDYPQVQVKDPFQVAPYIMIAGLAVLGFCSVAARRLAGIAGGTRLESAVRVFALVFTIGTLIIGAIMGISLFLANFMTSSYNPSAVNEGMRIVNVYLPILLDAVLLVTLILRAFVIHSEDEPEESK